MKIIDTDAESDSRHISLDISITMSSRNIQNAIGRGDVTKVNEMLDSGGVSVDARDKYGTSVMEWAVIHSQPAILAILLERGANVNSVDACNGNTVLMTACRNELFLDSVRLLLQRNDIRVDYQDAQGCTALMTAACTGNEDAMGALLDAGADIDVCDMEGATVLDYATMWRGIYTHRDPPNRPVVLLEAAALRKREQREKQQRAKERVHVLWVFKSIDVPSAHLVGRLIGESM
jgi:ankyrin repeat protein